MKQFTGRSSLNVVSHLNLTPAMFLLGLGLGGLLMNLCSLVISTQPAYISDEPKIAKEDIIPVIKNFAPDSDENNPLPGCDELMKPSFSGISQFGDGSFLTRKSTHVVWKMRHDGSRELTLPLTCSLKRYTAHQAGKCLKDKNLLFIGDSLTRYMFLCLIYFIEHKTWPKRFHSAFQPCQQLDEQGVEMCSKATEPSILAETDWKQFGDWPAFMQSLGGGADGGVFHGRMEAKSVRADVSVEAYQYVSSEEDGGTKLSYVSEFGWLGNEVFRGWNFTGCAHNATCRYTQEHYQKNTERNKLGDFDWEYPNITTAFGPDGTKFHALHQGTDYVFYNRGLWGPLTDEKAKLMMQGIRCLTGGINDNSRRCFFRSTTGSERSREMKLDNIEFDRVRKAVYSSGCEYFDVAHITDEFSLFVYNRVLRGGHDEFEHVFWDPAHYVPWVYEEINNLLLNILCNAKILE